MTLANRRVSFAPEATLHTWNVVEIPDESTSSSAANSTKRGSLANAQNQQAAPSPAKEAPSSPSVDGESDFGFSPVREQDLQQMRDRSASSGDEGAAELSSSPFSGSSVGSEDTGAQSVVEEEDDHSSGSDDGFDVESTAMGMDDMTAQSSATMQSDASGSSSSSARLNEALRQAAKEAGTQVLDDENGEMSMEIAGDEITGAFQPWIKKGQTFEWEDTSARVDQENVEPSKAAPAGDEQGSDGMDEDEDLSMDVTNAVGRILGKSPGRRQSVARRKSTGQETTYDDQTMEMTGMVGGIAQPEPTEAPDDDNEDEEMTMEFTSAVGGLLSKDSSQAQATNGNVELSASDTPKSDRMDDGNESDGDLDMEMTGAVGGILPSGLETQDKSRAKMVMEMESDSGQLGSSPFQENVRPSPAKSPSKSPAKSPAKSPKKSPAKSPAKSPLAFQVAAVASENGSPSLASVRSRPSRRSSTLGPSSTPGTPASATRQRSPSKKPSTPSKQLTPQTKPTTPSKTPPSANVSFRSASPKKLFQAETQPSAERRKSLRQSLFEQNASTGESTPRIVFPPREERRSSGLGIDKEGLGSPRVAALLDNRQSLGENTPQFVPQERPRGGVRFENPLKMQADEERDHEQEELREDGHMPPADGDVPSSLRDMISSMSPKKPKVGKVGSRKSLHVGAARGILGKRPIELDLEEEEAENSPKRLRGHDVSPVKGVKLPAPATQDAIARRSIRSPVSRARSSSPLKGSSTPTQEPRNAPKTATTPLKNGLDALHIASDPPQPEAEEEVPVQEPAADVEPIQLQDFLKMTNIHFMELTTTKRRHTTAPGSATKKLSRPSSENLPKSGTITFGDCVAAGFCTVPMLELYQHVSLSLKPGHVFIANIHQVVP